MNREYRFEMLHVGQGHYFYAKNLNEAKKVAMKFAEKNREVVAVQAWSPMRGKAHLVKPGYFKNMSEDEIILYYKRHGYDVKNYGGK